MFTVEHILFNLFCLVIFFDEREWKWCGLTMFCSNFIDLDNFYSYQLDDGNASALNIHYLHQAVQLNLVLFFSFFILLISRKLRNITETPILAFIIGIVLHVVGDWWTWTWDYSVTGALVEIGVFVVITLFRARYSKYRFYIFLMVGHVCTIFTLGFIVYLILVSDEVDTTKEVWPLVVDNCLRFIMILPWFFLMRVAEVEVQAAQVAEERRRARAKSRRRDPMHHNTFDIENPPESDGPRHSRFPEGNRAVTTLMGGEDHEHSRSFSSSSNSPEWQSKIGPTLIGSSKSLERHSISLAQHSSKSSETTKESIEKKHILTHEIELSERTGIPRASNKDPTKIMNSISRGSGSVFSLGLFPKGECYE